MQPKTQTGHTVQTAQIDATLELRIRRRVENLPTGLQAHIARAQDVARELAPCHGIDPERAALGILAHDVARAMPGAELLERAAGFHLPIGPVEQAAPVVLHGPVGAELLRVEDGLAAGESERDIYQAVYWHTTFHPTLLDDLGKVVFLADKLDPNKRRKFPYQPEILDLARENLDSAVLEFLGHQIEGFTARGKAVHPVMLEAWQSLQSNKTA